MAATSPAPAAPGFAFDEAFEAPSTATTAAPLDTGFDLDTVFGAPQPETASEATPGVSVMAPLLEPGAVTHVASVSASSPAPASGGQGLAVEGLDVGDSGFDFGGAGDDMGDFGVGLSAASGGADGSSLYGALAPALEELASEIARSLSFYLERVPDAALSRIYLTGGGALLKNLDVYLTGRLGAPTSVFNPLQLLPVSAPVSPLTTNGPLYTVALGLALRDFVD